MPPPKLYADLPLRRTLQVAGDVLLVLWIWVWVSVARATHDATLALAGPGERINSSASGLADRLREAGDKIGGIPYVGDDVAKPFSAAGGSADDLAAAGRSQVEAVHSLAFWLGLAVALIPITIALCYYLPPRIRFVRRASAGQRYLDASADLDLFALRAMSHQPLHVLARISDDPVAAWRAGDAEVVHRLAAVELASVGLRPPEPTGRA